MNNGKNNSPGIRFRVSNVTDKIFVLTSTSRTTSYTTNATKAEQMLTLEETILNGRDWETVTIEDVDVAVAIERKYDLTGAGLRQDEDFVWGYRQSEYDGFTMNRPRHAVYAFRDPAMASFYRLKWV